MDELRPAKIRRFAAIGAQVFGVIGCCNDAPVWKEPPGLGWGDGIGSRALGHRKLQRLFKTAAGFGAARRIAAVPGARQKSHVGTLFYVFIVNVLECWRLLNFKD